MAPRKSVVTVSTLVFGGGGFVRKLRRLPLLLLFFALTSACASVGALQSEPLDYGAERIFNAPLAEVLAAARLAIPKLGFAMKPENEVEDGVWMLIGTYAGGPFFEGANTRAVVRRKSETDTSVRLFSQIGNPGGPGGAAEASRRLERLHTAIFEGINADLPGPPASR